MIPDDLRRFIVQCIPSVPFLEAILLLRENRHGWDAPALAARLYLRDDAAAALLAELERAGLAARDDGGYAYAPRGEHLAAAVDALADVYRRHLVEVATLIHSKSHRKAQAFADAFVWRNKES
jgi:Mn-dependent DtxR family transcriptional regulator